MEAETILNIEEITEKDGFMPMSGYQISTNKQNVKFLIDDEGSCCESWGYFLSEDDLTKFIGSNLLDITLTDTALNTLKLKENQLDDLENLDGGDIIFVNIHTSVGLLQFTAYNAHNGYYGHEVKIVSNQINHSEIL